MRSTLPEWAQQLNVHRLLWKELGIPYHDADPEDVLHLLQLVGAEDDRNRT